MERLPDDCRRGAASPAAVPRSRRGCRISVGACGGSKRGYRPTVQTGRIRPRTGPRRAFESAFRLRAAGRHESRRQGICPAARDSADLAGHERKQKAAPGDPAVRQREHPSHAAANASNAEARSFCALRPPLPQQYARWTGPDRNVPEPDIPYVGRRSGIACPTHCSSDASTERVTTADLRNPG